MRAIIVLSMLCLLLSCTQDNEGSGKTWTNEIIKEGNVNFTDLKVGQKSYFKYYRYNCTEPIEDIYTGDTLVLELISEGTDLYFKEYHTSGSTNDWDPIQYLVTPQEGMIEIKNRTESRLFNFYGSDIIKLKPTETREIIQNSCSFDIDDNIFIGDEMGYVQSVDIQGMRQHSKLIVSCIPSFDLNGYLIYDSNQLMMSHRYWTSTWWTEPDVILSETSEGYTLIN